MKDCIFCKIAHGAMNNEILYEDENVIAFADINPAADVHILFVPRDHVDSFEKLSDDKVLSSVRKGVQEMVKKHKLVGKGYKLLVNGGGAQIVGHLHFHLIGPIGTHAEL